MGVAGVACHVCAQGLASMLSAAALFFRIKKLGIQTRTAIFSTDAFAQMKLK